MDEKKQKSEEELLGELAKLEQLKTTGGWLLMLEQLDMLLAVLADQIITKMDNKGEAYSESEVDRLRDRHADITRLKDMPANLHKHLASGDDDMGEMKDFDPFDQPKART